MFRRHHIGMFRATLLTFAFLLATIACGTSQDAAPKVKVTASADFLSLHVTGVAPAGSSGLRFRMAESGWIPVNAEIGADGSFAFDLPLQNSRWTEVAVQALAGDAVLAEHRMRNTPAPFKMLTDSALATLPPDERAQWDAYLKASSEKHEKEFDMLAEECRRLGLANSIAAPASKREFEISRSMDAAWFASDDARQIAAAIISFQTPSGGWSKAVDYHSPRTPGMQWTPNATNRWHYCGTIDNRSTTEQLKFLALFHHASASEEARAAVVRGLEWILAAQYPNGGWPQNYPLEAGYHEAITLNDNATTHVLELLLAISEGDSPFSFLDEGLRRRAALAYQNGLSCLLKAQVMISGELTVWCAQHHPLTLEPVAARLKEPPSLSGSESADFLRFLMRSGPRTAEVRRSIEAGLAWLDGHRITGLRKTSAADGSVDFQEDPTSAEVYWARFYDVQTGKPIFAGAQDGIVYTSFAEMAAHNKVAYDYFTQRPAVLFEKEIGAWRKRLEK